MNILKKVLNVITNIFLVLVFIILALVIFAKAKILFTNDKCFNIFGYSLFEVTTGSMSPTINQNDIVIVKKDTSYNVGDVVTYISNKDFITHRIVGTSGAKFITQGDANNTTDKEVEQDMIVGRVIKTYSNLGIWKKILTEPKVLFLIFITLVAFDFAFSYKGKPKSEESDNKIEFIKDKIKSIKIKKDKIEDKKEEKEIKQEIKEELKEEIKKELKEEIKDNKKVKQEIKIVNNNKEENKIEEKTKKEPAKELTKEEVKEVKKELESIEEDYTIRFDIEQIKEKINNKVNKEK